MDSRALIRLRIAFVLLAVALLAPLALLTRSMNARLDAQRRLRHEIVAERIFDEMERELTALLQGESARPSEAYAASSTRVENWAPFVVGYFTRDAATGVRIVAESQLAPDRVARLSQALARLAPVAPRDRPPTAARDDAQQDTSADRQLLEEKKSKSSAVSRAPEAILKQLNRGADQREQVQRKTKEKNIPDALQEADPLGGL